MLALSGIALTLSFTTAPDVSAQDTSRNQTQKNSRQQDRSDGSSVQPHGHDDAKSKHQAQIPEMLQDLDLKDQQKEQIRTKMSEFNNRSRQALQKYNRKHLEAVELEAAWVAAVRNTLSEEDQQTFDRNRQTMSKKNAMKEGRAKRSSDTKSASNRDSQDSKKQYAKKDKSQEQRSADSDALSQSRDSNSNRQSSDSQQSDSGNQEGFWVVTVTSPVIYMEGTNSTQEQKSECDKMCQQFSQRIEKAWSETHELHHKLVMIEAERLMAIEKILTDDQLKQLEQNRNGSNDLAASTR
ncbi:hypothetical protein Pla52nx_002080 [Stieleria varia]